MSRRSPWAFLICPPVAAEVGFGARNAGDHAAVRSSLATFPDCERHPTTAEVLEIQTSLIDAGLFRAVGALDTVIAAYALVNEATVLHYDRDFEHVATVTPDFAQRWIAPPGTLDR